MDETWVTDGAQVGAGGLRAATALGTRSRVCLCGARGASSSPCGARSSLSPTRAQHVGAPAPRQLAPAVGRALWLRIRTTGG